MRLAVLFVAGFAILLAAAGAGLYWWLEREYRADFDRELSETAQSAQALFSHDRAEFATTAETAAHLLTELIFVDRLIVATDQSHRRIASTLPYAGVPLLMDDLDLRLHAPRPVTVSLAGGRVRVIEEALPDSVRLLIAMPLAPLEQRLRQLRLSLMVGLPLILLLGGIVGEFASASALQPISRLAGAADVIAGEVASGATSFSALPTPAADDEIGRLTPAIGTCFAAGSLALQRDREIAEQQRRFLPMRRTSSGHPSPSSAAPRTLPSPPTTMRQHAGMPSRPLRRKRRASGAWWPTCWPSRGRGRRPRWRPGAGVLRRPGPQRRGSPAAAAHRRRAGDRIRGVCRGAGAREPGAGGAGHFRAGAQWPSCTRPGRAWSFSTGNDGSTSWMRVRDWGPGVPPGAELRVFERFERVDAATPGSGLGLAIARQIAEVHDGALVLERPAGGGTAFLLRLPSLDGPSPHP